jgi:shikimate dehydrogenase
MHNAAFQAMGLDATYVALRPTASEAPAVMAALARDGGGGNVTIPFKGVAAAMPWERDLRVTELGAANVFGTRDGRLHVGNTDVDGVLAALDRLSVGAGSIGVIGTGGSARAVVGAARERAMKVAVRSRDAARGAAFAAWAESLGVGGVGFDRCAIVVNATPLGLKTDDSDPIDWDALPGRCAVLDLTYRRGGATRWVERCRQRGLQAIDGRDVLVAQGAASWRLWFPQVEPPLELMKAVVDGRMD